jgi:hypothetical protein
MMVKYDFIFTVLMLAAVDVCASTIMKSKAGKPERGVYLSAKGGVSFGEQFNSLKVEGSTAQAIIRGGTLDASNSGDNGLHVRNNGEAYVCKTDLIKGGTCTEFASPCSTGDGSPGVLLSDSQASTHNSLMRIVNARIEGGNADVENGIFGGAGLYIYRGQAEIVSKKSTIVGGLNPDGTSRWVSIDNLDGSLTVYEGHIGDTMTGRSLNNFGVANIYGGKWMGSWRVGGSTYVYGNLVHDDVNDKLTGTLCDGNEIDIQVEFEGGGLTLDQNCDHYEDYVTNTLPYPACE